MSSRARFYRPWLWSAAAILLSAGPVAAQPPSSLELVRGLREHGMNDLALEYLKDVESQPLSPEDKAAIGLERAKCLLEASEDEADEGTRIGMVTLAKEGLNAFLIGAPNHPRRVEGLLAQAKLISLDAREQLNRARRIDIPGAETKAEEDARDAAQMKQKAEAAKARPLFLLASKRYAEASELLRSKVEEKAGDQTARRALEREVLEADLAAGINQFNTAETYMPVTRQTVAEREERNKYLEASKEMFGKLDKGGSANRTVWVARAWIAEVTFEQDDFNTAGQMVAAILKANVIEAEDGKRLARFFQLRRNYVAALGERTVAKVSASERELFTWLQQYGNPRKPTAEVFAVRYYRARLLQLMAESTLIPPKGSTAPVTPGATARAQLVEAERLYRGLAQSDHDYTARATRNRVQVVRRLLGDADQPLSSYDTFEKAQMASIIHLGKLSTEEGKKDSDAAKVQAVRMSAIALLERARELATPADNQADVTDVLLRLIYFYQQADMPYKSAVLGDHASRTIRGTGGKAAVAGLLGLNGYALAAARLKADPAATQEELQALTDARKADRGRAMALARFLDEKYPNDTATDSARFQLGRMLTEDKRYADAFAALLKVRPGYQLITEVRLLEGYLASQLVLTKESPLDPAQKIEVFKRAVVDLAKAARPANVALESDVRGFVSARCRLASLMFAQGRVDPAAEKAKPGYDQALSIADEVIGLIPTFDCLVTTAGGAKKLNLDGLEMLLLAKDVRARALYLRGRALIDAGNLEAAGQSLEPAIADIDNEGSAVTAEMKAWGADGADADAQQKEKILKLAAAVDKTRIEVLLAGFRLRITQGKDSAIMLDLIGRVGGTIEENLPVLEALGRETAAKMITLKKEGKVKEAQELGVGLGVLLNKIRAVPTLTTQQLLFIGQMLVAVGDYTAGIESLKKVPEPEFKQWRETAPDKLRARQAELKKIMDDIENAVIKTLPPEELARAADPEARPDVVAKKVIPALQGKAKDDYGAARAERIEVDKKVTAIPKGLDERHPGQMSNYAFAQLAVAKALREDKQYQAAEKLLTEIVGTQEKPGWGSGRLYFRKELAAVFEERAATVADVKVAGPEWGRALQIWQTMFNIHRSRLQKLPPLPKLPENATDEQKQEWKDKEAARKVEERTLKNNFADAYFEQVRCTAKANQQLRKALPDKLQKSMEDAAKSFVDMEKQIPQLADWDAEVQHRYVDLLKELPAMLAAYKAQGGKIFLEKKPLD